MNPTISRISAAVVALSVLVTTAAQAAVYTFNDTTFNNADWSGVKHVDTTPGALATFAAFQSNPGGSPILPGPATPDYRLIRHGYNAGAIVVSHQGLLFNWTPAPLETATTANYNYDLKFFDGPAGAVGFKPAIFQGGNVYVPTGAYDDIFGPTPPAAPFPFGWQRFTGGPIPIASFDLLDPSTGLLIAASSPNPTAAMGFGFVSANSATGQASKISGLDDFRFELNTVVVPEPTTLAAVGGLMTLLVRRRR